QRLVRHDSNRFRHLSSAQVGVHDSASTENVFSFYPFPPFSSSASTAFNSSTAPSSSAIASVASSSGSGRSSGSSSDSFFNHLKLSSLNSRSFTSAMPNERQRSSFESAGLRLARPSALAP